MTKVIDLKVTDACPGCGGTFRKAPQPTPEQREAAKSRDDSTWVPLPPHFDTAPLEVVKELGELWKCIGCGMPHRVKPEDVPAGAGR